MSAAVEELMEVTEVRSESYMRNALGQDVPVSLVKEIDKMRDNLVRGVVADYQALAEQTQQVKRRCEGDLEAFLQLSAERFGAELGGKKGNVTVYSYDGKLKLVRQMSDYMVFDEGLAATKELIDQCLTDWTQTTSPEIKLLIDRAFRPNSHGRISTSAVLGLRQLAINDERWIRAMHAIGESLKVVSSKAHIRAYRQDEGGDWQPVGEC
ncbi:MAG: DUF3164 family protein [Desulfovibrio sp.]|jgi:hypothetical protein|nr:DUF3164 family protein [Desulfovibrio sp.]